MLADLRPAFWGGGGGGTTGFQFKSQTQAVEFTQVQASYYRYHNQKCGFLVTLFISPSILSLWELHALSLY